MSCRQALHLSTRTHASKLCLYTGKADSNRKQIILSQRLYTDLSGKACVTQVKG